MGSELLLWQLERLLCVWGGRGGHLSVGAFGIALELRVSETGMIPSIKELSTLRRGTYVVCTMLRKEKSRCTRSLVFLTPFFLVSGPGVVESRELWVKVGALPLSQLDELRPVVSLGVCECGGQRSSSGAIHLCVLKQVLIALKFED